MDKKRLTYYEQKEIAYVEQLQGILEELPSYAKDYFKEKEASTNARTRISYAYDLRIFFQFLCEKIPYLLKKDIKKISIQDLDQLTSRDIKQYQEYLKFYRSEKREPVNSAVSIARKMSSLRSFFNYFFKREILKSNPVLQVDMPKIEEKKVTGLKPDEIVDLLDRIESYGNILSGQKKVYYEKTKLRDLAIITLLLGTGIRVSECVGLDLGDINFKRYSLKVTRKGEQKMTVYFGEEVALALQNYIENCRIKTISSVLKGHENALFFSTQKKRISVHAVENIVEKYSKEFLPNKKVTPHKLRSSYGMNLYQKTGDIYLVADALGQTDIYRTKKNYVDLKEEQRRQAASAMRLRNQKDVKSNEPESSYNRGKRTIR